MVHGGFGKERVELRFQRGAGQLLGHVMPRNVWFTCPVQDYESWIVMPLRELRARWLLDVAIDDVRSLRITVPDQPPLELARDDLGQFRIARPVAAAVDPTAIGELVQAFRGLGALDFVDHAPTDLARYGLDAAAVRVEIESASQKAAILLGADSGDAASFCKRVDEPQVVTVPREVVRRLRRPFTDLVERRVLAIESSGAIQSIRRDLPDGSAVTFARGDDGRFARTGAEGPALDLEASLDALRDLRAETVLLRSEVAESAAAGRLTIIAPSGQQLAELELWQASDGRVLCATPRVPGVVFRLSARDGRDLIALR